MQLWFQVVRTKPLFLLTSNFHTRCGNNGMEAGNDETSPTASSIQTKCVFSCPHFYENHRRSAGRCHSLSLPGCLILCAKEEHRGPHAPQQLRLGSASIKPSPLGAPVICLFSPPSRTEKGSDARQCRLALSVAASTTSRFRCRLEEEERRRRRGRLSTFSGSFRCIVGRDEVGCETFLKILYSWMLLNLVLSFVFFLWFFFPSFSLCLS